MQVICHDSNIRIAGCRLERQRLERGEASIVGWKGGVCELFCGVNAGQEGWFSERNACIWAGKAAFGG